MNISIEKVLEKARNLNRLRPVPSDHEINSVRKELLALMQKKNAQLVCHYYVDAIIQDFAISSGGIVADSLEMARYGKESRAEVLIVAGVRFMGETAKILSPDKQVIMPNLAANCSLDLGCEIESFKRFCSNHPERTVVVYANTSAEVKAFADWVVTSSCAIPIINHLKENQQGIIFAPDMHLGDYLKKTTGADILNWDGHCVVHDEFKAFELKELKKRMPDAEVVIHPESPPSVIELADFVGSTSQMINFVASSNKKKFIIGTDNGLIHMMKKKAPDKQFLEAPTAGNGATCKSCAHCPWMEMNDLRDILGALRDGKNEIVVPKEISYSARKSIEKMLAFNQLKDVSKNRKTI